MKTNNTNAIFKFTILSCFLFGTLLFGQKKVTKNDSTIIKTDPVNKLLPVTHIKETILDIIPIEAIIEKPSVTLVPKKAKTDVGKVPLNIRSFDKELKTKPVSLSSYGEDLETGKKIKNIGKKPKK
jgi:hypothetical protein